MKQIQFHHTGKPSEVVECAEVAEPSLVHPDDVVVRVQAFPINPADILTLQGYYPRSSPESAIPGVEALGIVQAVGSLVSEVAPGDRVLLLAADNWVEKKVVKEGELVRLASSSDTLQLAGLKVNPATAACMLQQFVALQPGDWLLQNAANSAVGRAVIQIAKSRGLRTVNVVRDESVAEELRELGADLVLKDADGLSQRVSEAIGGASIRLALDAVGGASTSRLASCLASGGSLVFYGALSGEAASVNPAVLVFQDISIRGFWLTRYLASASRTEVLKLYAELEQMVNRGVLTFKVDSVFPAEEIAAAVRRADGSGRKGKVFVTFPESASPNAIC